MYSFCTHTWNAIKGKCSHDCSYCFMKVFPQAPLHLDEKEFKTDLGTGNTIFVGSSTDMFANDVPIEWIEKVLEYCRKFDNTYIFQTKNVQRMLNCAINNISPFPNKTIFGTTIETNRDALLIKYSSAPISRFELKNFKRKFITIEPIMDFDLINFVKMIERIEPEFVNIGADSKGHNLPEPSKEKIEMLITELKKFTKVNIKDNLNRLME